MAAERQAAAQKKLSGAVEIWGIPTDDLWCRDAGFLFAKRPDGSLVISHIQFNVRGKKQVHGNDRKIVAAIAARLGMELIDSGLVGEFVTERCQS